MFCSNQFWPSWLLQYHCWKMAESMLHCKSGATLQPAWARESSSVEIVLQAAGLSCRRTKLIFGGIELVCSIRFTEKVGLQLVWFGRFVFVEKVSGRCCKSIGLAWIGLVERHCKPIGSNLIAIQLVQRWEHLLIVWWHAVQVRFKHFDLVCFGRSVLLKKKNKYCVVTWLPSLDRIK